ncbi:MAG: hypothetical protein H7Y32_13235, partial [Chloroflexales bacterium]|nr:hypothetical protein [Chloroflexales bacterium]
MTMTRWARRLRALLALLAVLTLGVGAPGAQASTTNHAAVVVQFADGTTDVRRISFTEPSISGLEALRRAGLAIEERAGAVCRVERVGCPAADCFCAAPQYWAYYHQRGGQWQYATTGAAAYQVTDGAVEGWSWGRAL